MKQISPALCKSLIHNIKTLKQSMEIYITKVESTGQIHHSPVKAGLRLNKP
ncbi:hypothetical protein [Helicobacter sp. MIT 05-5294]|uniref:hypothetical protein n=1 Tax=Helicobacter sp. MIT 05-5294 TaxID=1548150 RepID=UPI0018841CF3|nr:hypothetical protein [Helicobacter sp. MIT 05-5294]